MVEGQRLSDYNMPPNTTLTLALVPVINVWDTAKKMPLIRGKKSCELSVVAWSAQSHCYRAWMLLAPCSDLGRPISLSTTATEHCRGVILATLMLSDPRADPGTPIFFNATATEHCWGLIPAVSLHRQLPLVPLLQSMAGHCYTAWLTTCPCNRMELTTQQLLCKMCVCCCAQCMYVGLTAYSRYQQAVPERLHLIFTIAVHKASQAKIPKPRC